MQNDTLPIGRVVATEAKPSTAYSFSFWTADDSKVGIGTLVVVRTENVEVFGVVVEGFGFTDLGSPLHDYIGSEGDPNTEPPTLRPEIKLYSAAVLRVEPEEPLQPVPVGPVYLADDVAVARALRMDAYVGKSEIPVGLYQNGDLLSPVYLDSEFLLGPEAAHLNITGVSGLATKTSSIEFVLQSIFSHFREDVAVVCFNVKGCDMLFLDFPASPPEEYKYKQLYIDNNIQEIPVEDIEKYDKLNTPCQPFEKVYYYAPYKFDRLNLNTLRTHPDLIGSVKPLSWGLQDILEYTEVVLNRDDVDAKADALIQYIRQRVVGQISKVGEQECEVRNFQHLNAWFDAVLREMEESNRTEWKTHHYATIRKVFNRLTNLSTRYEGLISPDEYSSDLPWGTFEDRGVYVIDVAKLDAQAQDLVFTRVVSKLREHLEAGNLGVKHVIVVVDELNKYAPSDGQESYLKQTLLDISERGRYLGLVLFSAQQFRSQVHKRVVGNSATCLYGRMDMDELATPGYQVLTSATKEKLATLSKGQLMIRHPHFNQPIFVKFPRPNVLRGPDGIKMFPPADDLPLDEAVYRNLCTLNPDLSRNEIKDIVASADDDEETKRAMHVTLQRRPDDPVAYFRNSIKKKANIAATPDAAPVVIQSVDHDVDPFERI
ncbi:MAG: ATP-binding protein [Armatimonadetes bacterium]|jgi:DNA helicase HerA-like ATPase|nr:ATP-binding protein [Armatimonadota bacterium]